MKTGFLTAAIVLALASGAYAAAVSDVVVSVTLFPDNAETAPGPSVFDGPPGGPRTALDRTNAFGWGTAKGKEIEDTFTLGTVATATASATYVRPTPGYPLEGPHADVVGHTDAGPPGPSLGYSYAAVWNNRITFANLTGSGGPTPPAVGLWTDWTLTIDWNVVLGAPNPATDWAYGGVTVRVTGAGVDETFMTAFDTNLDGPAVNEPPGGADVVVPMSFYVPANSTSEVKVTVSLISIAAFEDIAPPPDRDFGDAPDLFDTLEASDGPRYSLGDVRLGTEWDREPDGQPGLGAALDDITGVEDEDGVYFDPDGFEVEVTNMTLDPQHVHLDGWIDLNYNGVFEHPAEQVIDVVMPVLTGTHTMRWDWLDLGLLWFNVEGTYSRFRVTLIDDAADELPGGVDNLTDVTPWGEFIAAEDLVYSVGISHGEVEDDFIEWLPPLPGDADGDGDVDLDDFMILKINFGTQYGATVAEGDFDGDGDVDLDDFMILKNNFGA